MKSKNKGNTIYRIIIDGVLDEKWEDWFNGLVMFQGKDNTMHLEGFLDDQAALHGVLSKIRDLGLPLVLVERMSDHAKKS